MCLVACCFCWWLVLLLGVFVFFGGMCLLCDVFGELCLACVLFDIFVFVFDLWDVPIGCIVCLISGVSLFGGCIWMVWWFALLSKCLCCFVFFVVWRDALFGCHVLSVWAVFGCFDFCVLFIGCSVVWLYA